MAQAQRGGEEKRHVIARLAATLQRRAEAKAREGISDDEMIYYDEQYYDDEDDGKPASRLRIC